MADLSEESRSLSNGDDSVDRRGRAGEDGVDEDFGYVKRDTALLEKALASRKSSAADNNDQGSGGSDVIREADVPRTSGLASRQPTVDNSYPYAAEVNLAGQNEKSASGILKPSPAPRLKDEPQGIKKPSGLLQRMSVSTTPAGTGPGKEDLPQAFQVKYLGHQDARGLWGIKHTRRPVDAMVAAAKGLKVGTVLPLVKLAVTAEGVVVTPITTSPKDAGSRQVHGIDTISYGVQDLVYTRVFSMIIVKDSGGNARDAHPFECHAFVCDSRHSARRLTYSLASAFQLYSRTVNAPGSAAKEKVALIKKRFAIDLRSPDEIEADLEEETDA